jgi:succinylglutamate desuccinylase
LGWIKKELFRMPITNIETIAEYIQQYNLPTNTDDTNTIYVYRTTSTDTNHHDKGYLTNNEDIAYYSTQNSPIYIAVFIEDPEILDADGVYTEVEE